MKETETPQLLHPMLQARIVNRASLRIREKLRKTLEKQLFLKGDVLEVRYALKLENDPDPTFNYVAFTDYD